MNSIYHLHHLSTQMPVAEDDSKALVNLWVPCEELLSFKIELPKVSASKQQELLPFMLEDKLLSEPDVYHFVIGPKINATEHLVFVLNKQQIESWLSIAQSAGYSAERMLPDYLALPFEEGIWSVVIEHSRFIVRTGQYTGFVSDTNMGWQQLNLALTQQSQLTDVQVMSDDINEVIPDDLVNKVELKQGTINWSFVEPPPLLNLLPKCFKPKKQSGTGVYLPIVLSALFCFFSALFFLQAQIWYWQDEVPELKKAVNESYRQLFQTSYQGVDKTLIAESEVKLELMTHRYLGEAKTPLIQLLALDSAISRCRDCRLYSVKQTSTGVSVTINNDQISQSKITSQLKRTSQNALLKSTWSNNSDKSQAILHLSLTADAEGGQL